MHAKFYKCNNSVDLVGFIIFKKKKKSDSCHYKIYRFKKKKHSSGSETQPPAGAFFFLNLSPADHKIFDVGGAIFRSVQTLSIKSYHGRI